MADMIEATDEVIAVVADAWDGNASTIIGGVAPLQITLRDGDEEPKTPVNLKGWARVTLLHEDADSFALGKRYRATGTAYVNIFVRKGKDAGRKAQRLAMLVSNAMKKHGTSNGQVELTNIRPNEAGRDGIWEQMNVLARFTYIDYNGISELPVFSYNLLTEEGDSLTTDEGATLYYQ